MVSCASHESNASNDSRSKLVRSASNSPVTPQRKLSASSPTTMKKKGSYSKLKWGSKGSLVRQADIVGVAGGVVKESVAWEEGDVFLADLDTGLVTLASPREKVSSTSGSLVASSQEEPLPDDISETVDVKKESPISEDPQLDSIVEVEGQCEGAGTRVDRESDIIALREKPAAAQKGDSFYQYATGMVA